MEEKISFICITNVLFERDYLDNYDKTLWNQYKIQTAILKLNEETGILLMEFVLNNLGDFTLIANSLGDFS